MHVANTIVEARCLALEAKLANLRVHSCPNASGSQPKSNTKKHRISPAKGVNKLPVEDQPRTNKSHLRTSNRVDSSSRLKRTVIQIVLWYLDSSCSKHMMEDRSRLMNFMKKFIGTVRFWNDHFGAIVGYGDYKNDVPVPPSTGVNSCPNASGSQSKSNTKKHRISPAKGVNKLPVEDQPRTNKSHLRTSNRVDSSSRLKRTVYYVKGLGHNLFSVGQFYDSDLEVAFKKHSCYVRDTDGVELIKGSCGSNLYTISVEDMMKSSPICLLSKAFKNKSWLWHRRLNHLNFGTINDLNSTTEGAVERRNRTLVEAARIMLISKALMFLWAEAVATASKILESFNQQLILEYLLVMHQAGKGIESTTIHVQFDELTEPMPPVHLVQALVSSAGTPSSTTIYQDAPSLSISPSSLALQSHSLHQGITAEPTYMEDHPIAPVDNNPFVNVFASEPHSEASSSEDISST
nr:integrase, catalytic region, zinc finger, CCHC-type, peptidase aspartic, catalytic [Tanacetum cinerariifolium]